jgi:hypothetical protein
VAWWPAADRAARRRLQGECPRPAQPDARAAGLRPGVPAARRAAHSAGRPGAPGARAGQPRRAEPAGRAPRRQEACAEGPPQRAVFAVAPQPLPALPGAGAEFRLAPAGGLVDRGRLGRGAVVDRAAGAARFEARRLAPGASRHPMRPPGERHGTSRSRPASLRKPEKMFVSCGSSSPGLIGPRLLADPAHMRKTAPPRSNANNTTKLRQLAALLTTWQSVRRATLCAQSSAVTCQECGGAA